MILNRRICHACAILTKFAFAAGYLCGSDFLLTVTLEFTKPPASSRDPRPAEAAIAGVHPVREALLAGRPIDRVLIAKGAGGPHLQQIIELCRERGIPLRFEPRDALDRATRSATHQGVVAFGAAHRYLEPTEIPSGAELVVVLDGIEDPHNLGAIIRTAHAAGAAAIMVPERRAPGLTETVAKAAAGALEHLPVVRIGNVSQTLESLKSRGFWIYGLDERGAERYSEVDYARPTALVLGAEGRGLHEHVRKRCDFIVRIPMAGAISSLNVSVAAGVVLFEWRRKRSISA
jgi:23S rRNA (guanosine2251-2'-O)-methyltransferase